MSIFNRKPPRGPAVFGELDLTEADELHQIAVDVLKELGRNVRTEGIGTLVEVDGERVYGLHNLAVHLAPIPKRHWGRLVREHFATSSSHEDSPDAATASQVSSSSAAGTTSRTAAASGRRSLGS